MTPLPIPAGPSICARMAIEVPSPVDGKAPRKFMWMPAGVHTICGAADGKEKTITVEVNPETATAIQRALEAWRAHDARRPFFDFDHKREEASAWPERFDWEESPKPGVYVTASWSEAGERAVLGKNYRGFSPEFYPDKEEGTEASPARVVFFPLTAGGLTNKQAFQANAPFWASEPKPQLHVQAETISAAGAAAAVNENKPEKNMSEENKAAVAAAAADVNKGAVEAAQSEIIDLRAKLAEADKAIRDQRTKDATTAVQAAVKRGALPAQNTELQSKWQKWCETSPEMIGALEAIPGNPAITAGQMTSGQPPRGTPGLQVGFSIQAAMKEYSGIVARNSKIKLTAASADAKRLVAIEAAQFYKQELEPHWDEISMIPVNAIAAATEGDSLGTLAGTLVLQRSLPLFKYEYPVLASFYTDFSATPGLYNQTEETRVITVPAVQTYDPTVDSAGRPKGWQTVVAAQATDVPIKLDEHVGVPIVFGQDTLAATIRRLFDEQAPAAIYAMAKYYVAKTTALMTPAKFTAYAVVKDGVPDAYPTYAVSLKNMSMDVLDDLEAIFDQNEVPSSDRMILLNAKYHGAIRKDPRLGLFFAAMQKPDMITEGKLPKLNGFLPQRAPWLPKTNNLVGFAAHRAAIVLKQRLPTDFTQALGVMIPGSVTTIADPESGLSCLLVQYVSLQGNYAEWRVETLLGAGVGDNRGGLCLTS